MWKITLKGVRSHKVRLVLTTVSVVLGVAFVSGTYVLTDTMQAVFDDLVRGGSQTIDVMIRPAVAEDIAIGSEASYYGAPTLPEDLVSEVGAVEGVERAEGSVEGYAQIVTPDGTPITPMGPPTLGVSWSLGGDRVVRDGGHEPTADDEVVIDAITADRNGLGVGDRVQIVFAATPPRTFTVVGLSTVPDGDNLAGATLAEFDFATAQQVLDLPGVVTGITVRGTPDVDADDLADRVAAVLPDGAEAITAADWADETMAQISDALGFLTTALGVFAAIALVVGAFIIANTFSITVVQRTREFALFRALGASRRQIVQAVLGEAVVVGVLASALGVVAGLGLALLLQGLLDAFGMDMPTGALVLEPRTVVVSLAVGIVVTAASALLPARRAAGIHPMAALRDTQVVAYRPPRARMAVGLGAAGAAAALLGYGGIARPDSAGVLVGAGAGLSLLALVTTGPALTRPVLRLLGGDGAHLGAVGRLARRASLRTPRRTWTTAAALTVGLALVSAVAVMAASMKASVAGALDRTLRADVVLTAGSAFMGGSVPTVLAEELAALPELAVVSPLRAGFGAMEGESATVIAVEPSSWDGVAATTFTEGSVADLEAARTVAVDAEVATAQGYAVGDVVTGRFPGSGEIELRIAAIFEPDDLVSGWMTSTATSDELLTQPMDAAVLAAAADGVDAVEVQAAVAAVADAYPSVVVQDRTEYGETVAGQVDQLLALVTALLGMALFIAVLGIMNTLALSISERTREIGMLRAVGMTRRQVRAMVRWESIGVAALGALVGLALGSVLGWATTRALGEQGMTAFVVPVLQLAGAALLAVLAGVLAAVLPARSAARLDVLRAIAVE